MLFRVILYYDILKMKAERKELPSSCIKLETSAKRENNSNEIEESPHEAGVIIHVVPEVGKARWNHIEDLDSFFTRMYLYHQKHGFACMLLQEVLELVQFIFIVVFSTFLLHCINYSILFKDNVLMLNNVTQKVSIADSIMSSEECLSSMGLGTWLCLIVASVFWILRAVKVFYHAIQFWDIKLFFNIALKIKDSDLDNLTWHEVQKRVREVQKEQEMCIHKRELSELDIYHRILRFKNYMVAMINKSIIPVTIKIPFLGEIRFMTRGLKYNLQLLLFWGPWSPFQNSWHLKEDYKKITKRQELARVLSKNILWVGVINFILCPLILLWQILYSFFNYGEMLKRKPDILGTRMWSLYGRLYIRHFNELDHELNARLNRAYRPAAKYMSIFTSPLMTVIAKNIAFIAGSIFTVLLILTIYDEDVLTAEHVLTLMTVMGGIVAVSRMFVPDENLVWCPESLLTGVLAHIHYRPDTWKGQAHTQITRAQVSQLFQYRAIHIFEELISPILTPYILCFRLRHRALDIVDFYRNFTIEITGVGDVCSFAQMDVRKHGNPFWQIAVQSNDDESTSGHYSQKYEHHTLSNQYTQAEDGKTELSLIHFTLTNPEWKPPHNEEKFIIALRDRARREANTMGYANENALLSSLHSLSSLGPEYNSIVSNIIRSSTGNRLNVTSSNDFKNLLPTSDDRPGICLNADRSGIKTIDNECTADTFQNIIHHGLTRAEGPLYAGEKGILHNLPQKLGGTNQSLNTSTFATIHHESGFEISKPIEVTAVDMSLSTLYLHELHSIKVHKLRHTDVVGKNWWYCNVGAESRTLPDIGEESIPLLQHRDSSTRISKES